MRFQKHTIPSTEQIEKLASIAASGDAGALKQLGSLSEKLARRANQNIRDLEKKGYTNSGAYKQASYELGSNKPRYSQSRAPWFGEDAAGAAARLAENAKQSAKFLRYKTSTVGGMREKAKSGTEKIKAKLREAMPDNEIIVKDWKKIEKDLDKFLSSNAFGELRNSMGSTVIEAVAENISGGADINELLNQFKAWESGDLDEGILTLWDNWEQMT